MTVEKAMQAALKMADRSIFTPYRMGAVLVRGGKIVGRGYNRNSASAIRFGKKFGIEYWTMHAEIDALLNSGVQKGVLYVTGIKENGNAIDCRPCDKCRIVLDALGIEYVWTDKNGRYRQG